MDTSTTSSNLSSRSRTRSRRSLPGASNHTPLSTVIDLLTTSSKPADLEPPEVDSSGTIDLTCHEIHDDSHESCDIAASSTSVCSTTRYTAPIVQSNTVSSQHATSTVGYTPSSAPDPVSNTPSYAPAPVINIPSSAPAPVIHTPLAPPSNVQVQHRVVNTRQSSTAQIGPASSAAHHASEQSTTVASPYIQVRQAPIPVASTATPLYPQSTPQTIKVVTPRVQPINAANATLLLSKQSIAAPHQNVLLNNRPATGHTITKLNHNVVNTVSHAPLSQQPVQLSHAPLSQQPVQLSHAPLSQQAVKLSHAPLSQQTVKLSLAPTRQQTVNISNAHSTNQTLKLNAVPSQQHTVQIYLTPAQSLLLKQLPNRQNTAMVRNSSVPQQQISHTPSHQQTSHAPSHQQTSHAPSHQQTSLTTKPQQPIQISHTPSHQQTSHAPSHQQTSHTTLPQQSINISHTPSHQQTSHAPSHQQTSHAPSHQQTSLTTKPQQPIQISHTPSHQQTSYATLPQQPINISHTLSHQQTSNTPSHQQTSHTPSHKQITTTTSQAPTPQPTVTATQPRVTYSCPLTTIRTSDIYESTSEDEQTVVEVAAKQTSAAAALALAKERSVTARKSSAAERKKKAALMVVAKEQAALLVAKEKAALTLAKEQSALLLAKKQAALKVANEKAALTLAKERAALLFAKKQAALMVLNEKAALMVANERAELAKFTLAEQTAWEKAVAAEEAVQAAIQDSYVYLGKKVRRKKQQQQQQQQLAQPKYKQEPLTQRKQPPASNLELLSSRVEHQRPHSHQIAPVVPPSSSSSETDHKISAFVRIEDVLSSQYDTASYGGDSASSYPQYPSPLKKRPLREGFLADNEHLREDLSENSQRFYHPIRIA